MKLWAQGDEEFQKKSNRTDIEIDCLQEFRRELLRTTKEDKEKRLKRKKNMND